MKWRIWLNKLMYKSSSVYVCIYIYSAANGMTYLGDMRQFMFALTWHKAVYVCMHLYIYAYLCAVEFMHICVCSCMHTCVYLNIYTYSTARKKLCVSTKNAFWTLPVSAYIYIYSKKMYRCTHAYLYICIYRRKPGVSPKLAR